MAQATQSRPLILYFLMLFLTAGWSFIGWNFAGIPGLLTCLFIALVVNFYALTIKEDE